VSSERPTAEKSPAPRRADVTPSPSRWRRLLFWAIVLEIASVALFIATLLFGEQSRLTLMSLYLPRLPLLIAVSAGTLLAPITRRRVALLLAIQVALFLVVLFPVMGLAVSTSRPTDRPVRLASYNVFFGKAGRPTLIEEVVAMPADVVVIQAAFSSLSEKLRERLPERIIRQDDQFILVSKFPVPVVEVPPPLSDRTPAMFVKYVLDTPSGALRVYNVHPFSPRHALFGEHETGDDIAQREGQIEAAVAAARNDVTPFVIAGDTNLPALSAIGRRHFSGLTDAFADVGLGFGYTFPARRPWMRIDRVLGSEGVRFTAARVAPRGASDHRAVFVDLELVGGSR
jgi:endonuclease/exonuclease/phosphatase (EEP) superfamily protein YafD